MLKISTKNLSIQQNQILNIKLFFSLFKNHLIKTTINCGDLSKTKSNKIKFNRKYLNNTNNKNKNKLININDLLMTSNNDTAEAATMSSITATAAATAADRIIKQSNVNYSEYRYFENVLHESSKIQKFNMKSSLKHANGTQFIVMSYNILAQDLLELHPYLYVNHSSDALVWEYRLERLIHEILIIKPEILCLQEVQENHLQMIADKLQNLNLNYVYKKKTGLRSDGCAIFYNKNLFNLIEHHPIEFYQPNTEHLDRENVAIIAKFNLKSQPNTWFLVSTTHLLYNPKRQDVRLAQIQLLLAEIDRLSIKEIRNNELKRMPIILTGDFNLQPYSAPYHLLTKGNLYYYNLTYNTLETPTDGYNQIVGNVFLPPKLGITDTCQHIDLIQNKYQGHTRLRNSERNGQLGERQNYSRDDDDDTKINHDLIKKYPNLFASGKLTHNLNFTSVYDHKTDNGEYEGTTFQQKWITVDYIFYSKFYNDNNSNDSNNSKMNSVYDGCLNLLSRYKLPTVQQCHKIGTIPNNNFGSDHFTLAAKFLLHTS